MAAESSHSWAASFSSLLSNVDAPEHAPRRSGENNKRKASHVEAERCDSAPSFEVVLGPTAMLVPPAVRLNASVDHWRSHVMQATSQQRAAKGMQLRPVVVLEPAAGTAPASLLLEATSVGRNGSWS